MSLLRKAGTRLFRAIIRERLLLIFGLLGVILAVIDPQPWTQYRQWVDVQTLLALVALLIAIEGIRLSGYVQRMAVRLAKRTRSMRRLALLLVFGAAVFSMFLTNDVSLFLVVPLTVALGRELPLPVRRLVIFEALAVNAGSTLSPIGNPQNLLLWHRSALPVQSFVLHMLPAFLVMLPLLLALTYLMFDSHPLAFAESMPPGMSAPPQPGLGVVSAGLLLVVVVLLQLGRAELACALVLAVFGVLFRRVFARVDWMLLATFAVMFVSLGHLAQWSPFQSKLGAVDWDEPGMLYVGGVLLSQLISNVPATLLLSHYSGNALVLAMAVNVGGFGLGIGSLANIIALRLEGSPGALAAFHRVSLPFLLVCMPLVWVAYRVAG